MREPVLLSHNPDSPFHGVADHVVLRGDEAALASATLLVEVPHGADRTRHYDALRARLFGDLPDQLEHFFYVNTDVGAWQLGEEVARQLVQANPTLAVELVRCRIPRTFVDTNRIPGHGGGDLTQGGMTPGLAPYITDPHDRKLLAELHRRYIDAVEERMVAICGAGGLAFLPHTYGPVTMGIERVDEDIVRTLHWALAPERADTWPVRPPVDVIHADGEGTSYAPPEVLHALRDGFAAIDVELVENQTYAMHPSTMGMVWSQRFPHRVISLEVRRDLLVSEWLPFAEMEVRPDAVQHFAAPIAAAITRGLPTR